MTKTIQRALFGGVLLSAGMTAGTANAQFQIGYTAAHAYAWAYPAGNSDSHYGFGAFTLNTPAFGNYGYATANMDFGPGGLSGSVLVSANGSYSYAHSHNFYGEFSVDNDFMATVNWDFSQAGPFFTNYLAIVDVNAGQVFFAQSYSSGSQQLSLSANTSYQIYGLVDVGTAFDQVTSWWRLTPVPAPGSAALVGMAGLAASRRRRTGPLPR